MSRLLVFVLSVCSFIWLVYEAVHFHQVIRDDLDKPHEVSRTLFKESSGDVDKVLNIYYESIYRDIPDTLAPASLLMLGTTILFFTRRRPPA